MAINFENLGSLSLRRKFDLGVGIVLLLAIGFGVADWLSFREVIEDSAYSQTLTTARKNHLISDMMHNAIQTNVLNARLGYLEQDRAQLAGAQTNMKEDKATLRAAQDAIKALPLNDEFEANMAEVRSAWGVYVRDAELAIAALTANDANSEEAVDRFNRQAEVVEDLMAQVTQDIDIYVANQVATVRADTEKENIMLIAQPIILTILLVGFAWFIRRTLIMPIVSASDALFSLSQGDFNVAIGGTERRDEVGALARGIVAFKDKAQEVSAALAAQEIAEKQAREQSARATRENDRREALVKLAVSLETRVLTAAETVAQTARQLQEASVAVESAAQGLSDMRGTVADTSGGSLPGVTVTITNQASGTFREIVSNADGIVLRGHTLWVVQNFTRQISELKLDGDWASGKLVSVTAASASARRRPADRRQQLERQGVRLAVVHVQDHHRVASFDRECTAAHPATIGVGGSRDRSRRAPAAGGVRS
ncbi:MAG: hypothetical protein HC788_16170, partial [Sphingopyxis sp.]|nr:hypothetical protein [Sphingopyxis sp.]